MFSRGLSMAAMAVAALTPMSTAYASGLPAFLADGTGNAHGLHHSRPMAWDGKNRSAGDRNHRRWRRTRAAGITKRRRA